MKPSTTTRPTNPFALAGIRRAFLESPNNRAWLLLASARCRASLIMDWLYACTRSRSFRVGKTLMDFPHLLLGEPQIIKALRVQPKLRARAEEVTQA